MSLPQLTCLASAESSSNQEIATLIKTANITGALALAKKDRADDLVSWGDYADLAASCGNAELAKQAINELKTKFPAEKTFAFGAELYAQLSNIPQAEKAKTLSRLLEKSGYNFWMAKQFKESGSSYARAAALREDWSLPDLKHLGSAWSSAGGGYYKAGDFVSAKKYYKFAESTFENAGEKIEQSKVLGFLSSSCRSRNELDEALTYSLKQLDILEKVAPSSEELAKCLYALGYIYHKKEKFSEAVAFLSRASAIYDKIGTPSTDSKNCHEELVHATDAAAWLTVRTPEVDALIKAGDLKTAMSKAKDNYEHQTESPYLMVLYGILAHECGELGESQKTLASFVAKYPKDSRLDYVQKRLQLVTHELERMPDQLRAALSSDQYPPVLAAEDGAKRWSDKKILRVYVNSLSPDIPARFIEMTKDSAKQWQDASAGLLKFQIVANPEQSDIDVFWTMDTRLKQVADRQGNTSYKIEKDGTLSHATIHVLATQHLQPDKLIGDKQVHKVVLHELGHSFGLMHSKDPNDVMLEGNLLLNQDPHPSERDLALLQKLYAVSKVDYMNAAISNVEECRLAEAAPVLLILQERLALCLFNAGLFADSGLLYSKAAKLRAEEKNTDPKLLHHDLIGAGAAYFKVQDFDKAAQSYEQVCTLLQSPADAEELGKCLGFLSFCYLKQERVELAQTTAQRQYAILEKCAPGTERLADCIFQLGFLQYKQKQMPAAAAFYKRACDVYDKLQVHSSRAMTCKTNYNNIMNAQAGKPAQTESRSEADSHL